MVGAFKSAFRVQREPLSPSAPESANISKYLYGQINATQVTIDDGLVVPQLYTNGNGNNNKIVVST